MGTNPIMESILSKGQKTAQANGVVTELDEGYIMFKIITDSGADFRASRAKEMGIDVAYLKICFDGEAVDQFEDEDITRFYEKLASCENLPVTSQPSPQDFLELYEKSPDEPILVLTLSGGLSGTVNAAELAKKMLANPDRVTIIDTKHATLSQNVIVAEAVRMRDQGSSIDETAKAMEVLISRTEIVGLIDTLKYLKKGGRIPRSLANIGALLNIKPLLELRDGVLVTAGKARGHKAGMKLLFSQVAAHGIDPNYKVFLGYSGDLHDVEELVLQFKLAYPQVEYEVSKIGGILGTHIGAGSLGVGFVRNKK
jgi:DegV family protein with EDD domain